MTYDFIIIPFVMSVKEKIHFTVYNRILVLFDKDL